MQSTLHVVPLLVHAAGRPTLYNDRVHVCSYPSQGVVAVTAYATSAVHVKQLHKQAQVLT